MPTKFAGVKGIGLPAQLKPERLVVRIHPPVPRAGLMQQADMLHSKRSFSRFESEGRHQILSLRLLGCVSSRYARKGLCAIGTTSRTLKP